MIFLSFHKDQDVLCAAFTAGGKGYLQKDSALQEIVVAVQAVVAGKVYMSSAIALQLLDGGDATNS